MKTETKLAVRTMCQRAGVCRAGFYRMGTANRSAQQDTALREELQKIALEWPSYGSRRLTAELRRGGWEVNRKRVQRLMREDNLLCLRKRQFVVTTDSQHGLAVYRNLAKSMVLTGVDQLWVADITYIRLEEEFVYLAVILDAYSRRVIGWELDGTLEDCSEYRDLAEARARIGEFLEQVYNQKRLHSALDYLSPVKFERTLQSAAAPAARVSP